MENFPATSESTTLPVPCWLTTTPASGDPSLSVTVPTTVLRFWATATVDINALKKNANAQTIMPRQTNSLKLAINKKGFS
jgi:hypothetical protein